MHDSRH